MSSSELSQRAAQVLRHAIEVYLSHGSAVSSSQLAKRSADEACRQQVSERG